MKSGVVPGSDGAGTVVAIGKHVSRLKVGDRVCTTLNQGHLFGSLDARSLQTSLGGSLDGTFRQYGIFPEHGLVHMPRSLSFLEASALPCAGVTAWNALYGLTGRALRPGQTVLTLGTGGVSLFAVQFAIAAGATVIATTSSPEKEKMLKDLGVQQVINYRQNPQWGDMAKKLTTDGAGVDFVVEVGGATTLAQSLAAVRIDGVIAVAGVIGGNSETVKEPGLLSAWYSTCTVRGLAVGSRAQFEEMNRAIEASGIKPVIDRKIFALDELREAYQYLLRQKHVGKVVVKCTVLQEP